MNTRINAIPTIEQAMKTLSAFGYDVSTVWTQHNTWLATLDERAPDDVDRQFGQRRKEPSSIEEHFQAKASEKNAQGDKQHNNEPELLSAANCFKDRHYTLTPGQRDVLRNRYGLTPAQHIIVTDVALFKGTNIIWSVTIKSAEHIDPRRRRHVLHAACIAPAAKFFADGIAQDKEREAEAAANAAAADEKRKANGLAPISLKGRALAYME